MTVGGGGLGKRLPVYAYTPTLTLPLLPVYAYTPTLTLPLRGRE